MNILDWGCGRGPSVAWLRERGYNAFGVEIDPIAIHHGKAMLESRGHDVPHIISPINDDCIVNYPDNFFHFVFSTQVLEHVEIWTSLHRKFTALPNRGVMDYTFSQAIIIL